jgi:predicted  nucleic acid-binding Zn-ribbon protein
MKNEDFNLPQRKVYKSEIVKKKSDNKSQLTEKQMDKVIEARAQLYQDLGEIAKGIVVIAKIREEADSDVKRIEAETKGIESKIRAEIDHLAQVGKNTQTRGEIAVDIITALTSIIRDVPDLDSQSVHKLIDSISPMVKAAINEA